MTGKLMARPLAIIAACVVLTGTSPAVEPLQPPSSGVISGVVTDELNRPVPGVTVTAFRLTGSGQLVEPKADHAFSAQGAWADGAIRKETNDLGEFRLWPLEAGQYVVAVVVSRFTSPLDAERGGCWARAPRDWWKFVPSADVTAVEWLLDPSRRHLLSIAPALTSSGDASPAERGYVTTFSPRATTVTEARRVAVGEKADATGVDIQLQIRPAVRVTGRIAGVPAQAGLDIELTNLRGGSRTETTADGSFVFLNVPVGIYSLVSPGTTSTCDTRGSYGPRYEGRAEIRVEPGSRNHFTFTVGSQPAVERGPTQPPQVEPVANAGRIEGLVKSDAGKTLDRVRVRVTSAALREGATAVSGTDGRFAIENLPPDIYTLTVSRAGFEDQMYGLRPGGTDGTRIELSPGQRFVANVTMTRPGVIAGAVRNERGAPMPGVDVCCIAHPGWITTDDRGQFRLWPVPAGDRTVFAFDARGRGVLKGYLRTYYPGVTDEAAAQKVKVDPGTVRTIDIEPRLATVGPTASLTVRVRSADGAIPTTSAIFLSGVHSARQQPVRSGDTPELVATFPSVPAGRHSAAAGLESGDRWYGTAEVVTDGRTPAVVTIVAAQKVSVSVKAVFDGLGEGTRFFEWQLWRVANGSSWSQATYGTGSSLSEGEPPRAEILLTGRYALTIKPWGSWIASSGRLGGREVLDGPFLLEPGSSSELVITFTSRRTSLEGMARGTAGTPTAEADILVFSVNPEFWTPASRRIRILRPRSNGRYDVTGLPPGEYAVVAEQRIDPDDVNPVWLEARLKGAARVTLTEDKKQELTVRVR